MAKKCLMEKAARLHAAKAKDAKRVAEGKKARVSIKSGKAL